MEENPIREGELEGPTVTIEFSVPQESEEQQTTNQ